MRAPFAFCSLPPRVVVVLLLAVARLLAVAVGTIAGNLNTAVIASIVTTVSSTFTVATVTTISNTRTTAIGRQIPNDLPATVRWCEKYGLPLSSS